MSETQELLGKIRALRESLEQAQGLAGAVATAVAEAPPGEADAAPRLRLLHDRVAAGFAQHALLDGTLRQLTAVTTPADEAAAMPALLTSRARHIVERGRGLLGRLRALAEDFADAPAADPLAGFYRDTAAMTDTTLRTVQAFPDAPSAQLRLCEGLEAILGVIAERLAVLAAAVEQRRREEERIHTLAELLTALHAGTPPDVTPYVALAEALVEEANQLAPLRLPHDTPDRPARFVACHSLAVAGVVARVVRGDPEWRGRAVEAVLAALVHDVGMLAVPAAVLAHAGPLDDGQRRQLEAHVRVGFALAARLLPSGPWLAEAVVCHHERLDGTGYPGGRRELQLAALPRLLAVCDTYAALCTPRPHRPARETRTALTDTLLLAEQGALDRYHAERLLQLSFYPLGSVVELADGAVGVVVATPSARRELNAPARPVVTLLTDSQGRPLPLPQHLDLAQCDSRSIVRSLSQAERRDVLGRRHPELV
jgi:HD-GYP domain-containing protein (c-di-GMP phosphodiesterase class II)